METEITAFRMFDSSEKMRELIFLKLWEFMTFLNSIGILIESTLRAQYAHMQKMILISSLIS